MSCATSVTARWNPVPPSTGLPATASSAMASAPVREAHPAMSQANVLAIRMVIFPFPRQIPHRRGLPRFAFSRAV
jgi:hypothetical protein